MTNYFSAKKYLYFLFLLTALCASGVRAQNTETPEKSDGKDKEKEKIVKKDDKVVVTNPAKGRLPVIVIPGLIGTELINKNTQEKVWFDLGRSKDDDMRLPISANLKANRDNLVPGDILRKIQLVKLTPSVEIYQKLLEVLQADGFTEGSLDAPIAGGDADTYYVFAYDWRLDNVENAQNLVRKITELRTKLNRPGLKFNVIAHSMGGLIARYAAMYGDAPLTARPARPTWKGAAYFNSISMVATPNAGALTSLDSLINGFSLFGSGKLNLPFVQNLSKFDLFTIPSIYQLLPHAGTARAFDENLKPLNVDVYNVATWEKYGWATYNDKDFSKKFTAAEQAQAKAYLRAVLLRAKQFQAALDANATARNQVPMHYLGAECRQTIDGMIIRRDDKKGVWKTEFGADSYTKSNGEKVTKEETEKVLLAPGDGVVPKRSLLASFLKIGSFRKLDSDFLLNAPADGCDEHNRLTGNPEVVKNILGVLNEKQAGEKTAVKTAVN